MARRGLLLSAAAYSLIAVEAVGQTGPLVDTDCAASMLFVDATIKCQSAANRNNDGPRTASTLYATFGSVGKRRLSLALYYPTGDTVMRPYSAETSERAIKTFNGFTNGAERWSGYSGYGNTGYMTFKSSTWNCIGFDHAGPNKGEVSGYSFIVRGYVCEAADPGAPETYLKDFLSHVRVGAPSENRSALLTGYSPLPGATTAPSRTSAPTAASASPSQQQVSRSSAGLAVQWDGVSALASGTMSLTNGADGGDLSVLLSMTQGRCRGSWQRTTAASLPPPQTSGTWSLACANGEAASGSYTSAEPGKGSGSGVDAKGRKVVITFGQ